MDNKEKVILITGAGGELAQYNKPKKQLKNYANKNNFDFKYFGFQDNYKLAKIGAIEEVYKEYDIVIWVDYDVLVKGYDNILDYCDLNRFINCCAHDIEPTKLISKIITRLNKVSVINSGVMVINSKDKYKTYKFIESMISLIYYQFHNTNWKDNNALLYLTGQSNIIKIFNPHKILNIKYSRLKYKNVSYNIIDNKFNFIPNIANYKNNIVDEIVFLHLAGVKDRCKYLK